MISYMTNEICIFAHTSYYSNVKVGSYELYNAGVDSGIDMVYIAFGDKSRTDSVGGSKIVEYKRSSVILSYLSLILFVIRLRVKKNKIYIIDTPIYFILLFLLIGEKVFYRPTDIYLSQNGKWYAVLELFFKLVQIPVISTSKVVMNHYRSRGFNVIGFVDNGVGNDLLKIGVSGFRRSEYVYVGALDKRFDFESLYKIASVSKSVFHIIGGVDDCKKKQFDDIANVIFYNELPRKEWILIAKKCIGGLILINKHPANQGRSPMKLFEYYSIGLPVFARKTENLNLQASKSLFLYDDENLIKCFDDYNLYCESLSEDERAELRLFSVNYSWQKKLFEYIDLIEKYA